MDLVKKGSETAKAGFQNELDVVNTFNEWQISKLAQDWLVAMGYKLDDIEYVKAEKIRGSYKADIQVQVRITIKLKSLIDCQNIQVKLVSNLKGYNQVDKRWLKNYNELWNIPDDIYKILQHYTGELPPYTKNTKDKRRMFINEMTDIDQHKIICWITENQYLIVSDILKGRGKFSAEWVLVIQRFEDIFKWVLKPINVVMNYYSQGGVSITPSGNIKIGRITIQRKGGDNGRPTANMLQFKLDPTELFLI